MDIFNIIPTAVDWFVNDFYYRSLNVSISATFLILAIVLLRFVLKKAPKSLIAALWGLVAIRLILPFSLESTLSLVPSGETIPQEAIFSQETQHDKFTMDIITNPNYPETVTQEFDAPVSSVGIDLIQLEFLWLICIAAMLLYALISYIIIRRKVRTSVRLRDNVFLCDSIPTPFILGIIKPRIYIPSYLSEEDMSYVIAHETAHLKRKDHIWKPLGFVLLSVYWLNPAMWLAYILLCRDIELACDERVIKEMGTEIKKPYSLALINCSTPRKIITACPLAFGEVGVKDRVKSVLSYKKPAFWVIIVAVILSIAVAVCFMTNPISVNYDRIMNEQGFTITAQERALITLIVPLDKLPEKVTREHSYGKNKITVFQYGKASAVYLEKVTPVSDREDQIYLLFNMAHEPDKDGFILSTVCKDYSGFTDGISLASSKVSDSATQYENAVDLRSMGPDNQFVITISKDVYESAQDHILISVCCSIIQYTNDRSFNNLYVKSQNASSTNPEIKAEITNILTTDTSPYINIRWDNMSDKRLTIGEDFYIYRNENGKWVDCRKPSDIDFTFNAIGYYIEAQSFSFKKYSLDFMDLSEKGRYRFESKGTLDGEEITVSVEFELNKNSIKYYKNLLEEHDKTTELPDYETYPSDTRVTEAPTKELPPETTNVQQPVAPKNYPQTAVAFTGSRIPSGGLNADKAYISSIQHLPIYKFESRKEIDRFVSANGNKIALDSGWNEVPSVNTVLAQYDEAFFEENVLFAVFVHCSNCTYRFAVDSVYNDGKHFIIHVKQANNPQEVETMEAGWMLTYTAKKDDVKSCISFDAQLNSSTTLVTSIEDLTVTQQLTTDSALQPFYEDDEYVYSYPSIRNDYVIVTFVNGTQMTAKEALEKGYITIGDLDLWQIQYIKQPK
ncbi:MAG: hypothetical protein IKK49_03695 [Clostridia bacterium]|nr:hypothetical protein [Clostridia bacterium]